MTPPGASAVAGGLQGLGDWIVCPACRGALAWQAASAISPEGQAKCRQCASEYAVTEGIPVLVPAEVTTG